MANLLDNLVIAAPCSVSWDSMDGDERVRHCSGCAKNVYNISDMTKSEAESFLLMNGNSQCMRFYRRADGTIITDNCPVGLRKLRDRYRKIAALLAGFIASILHLGAPSAKAQEAPQSPSDFKLDYHSRSKPVRPDKPLPVGYTYQSNPAGGGVIMVPIKDLNTNRPVREGPLLGKPRIWPARNPNPRTVILGPDCAPAPVSTVLPESPSSTTVTRKDVHNIPLNGDMAAFDLWQQGRQAESSGKFVLAQTYYEQALKTSESQKSADPAFQTQIKEDLKMLKERIYQNHSQLLNK